MSEPADDRLLPATRWAALVIFIVLVPAVVVLWGTPGETADCWAWTIKPDLTPILLGYGAGAFYFWRTFPATWWHPSLMWPPVGGSSWGRTSIRPSAFSRCSRLA